MQKNSEKNIENNYTSLHLVFTKNCIALFIQELLHKVLKEQEADEDLFDFLKNSLMILDLKKENYFNFHLCFMLQLSRYLGFYPQGKYSDSTSVFDLQEGTFI